MVYLENIKLFISVNVSQREKRACLECLNIKLSANCLSLFLPLISRPLKMTWRENTCIYGGSFPDTWDLQYVLYSLSTALSITLASVCNWEGGGLEKQNACAEPLTKFRVSFLTSRCALGPSPCILTVNRMSWSTARVIHLIVSAVDLLLGEG